MFVEPCGEDTEEMYLQGMSSSLPEEVQIELYKTVDCLKNIKIMRNAYDIFPDMMAAIEKFEEKWKIYRD